jgi:hypothetical protein
MSNRQNLYVGRSGQLAVMAEFLMRGYNVAIPEVDVGEDLFVVRDDNGDLSRIQVKCSIAKQRRRQGYAASFNLRLDQLEKPARPEVHYVFAVRQAERWDDFIVIARASLYELHTKGVGSASKGRVVVSLSTATGELRCNNISLERYRNNWSTWPTIKH